MERLEAIILAGGLGTRLRGVIGTETPKCMAPVSGKPFLHYLLKWAEQHGIARVMLSLGHRSEAVTGWLAAQSNQLEIDWVVEEEPLGTGGGIQLALGECEAENVVVLNGDTMFSIDLQAAVDFHRQNRAETTLALKALQNFSRYGIVEKDELNIISAFQEKAPRESGLINGGIYIINRRSFLNRGLPEKLSFEKDYLERFVNERKFYGLQDEGYFIDIGVPEDYDRAQSDFQRLFSQP